MWKDLNNVDKSKNASLHDDRLLRIRNRCSALPGNTGNVCQHSGKMLKDLN